MYVSNEKEKSFFVILISKQPNFVAKKPHVFGKIECQKYSLVTKRRKQCNLAEHKQKRYFSKINKIK